MSIQAPLDRPAGTRSRRSEIARLAVAAALAAGAVALGESLLGSHHHSGGAHARPGLSSSSGDPSARADASGARAGGRPGSAGAGGGQTALPKVAGGPAVTRALRKGSMTVVIDAPPAGLFSEQNRSIARGAAIAVDELNRAGGLWRGVRIKLVRQTLDGLSADALRKRLQSEAAAVLILPCDTDSQFSLASSAASFGMLMLAPCNPDPQTGRSFPTYWPVGTAASDETLELASFMRMTGYGRVFIVEAPGSRYVELLTDYFRGAAQAKGVQLSGSAPIAMSARDFSGLAHAIQAAHPKPGAIFTALPPPFVGRLAAGLAGQGVTQTVLGTAAIDTRLTLSSGGEALNAAIFSSLGFPPLTASARRFALSYRKRFGADPMGGFPGLGLETIRLLQAAAHKARSAEPSAMERALTAGVALHGVGLADRSYQPGGDHNPIGVVAITKIASGSFLPLFAGMPGSASR